jgi:hypothetical protein
VSKPRKDRPRKRDGEYVARGRQFKDFIIWVDHGRVILAGGSFHWAVGHKWKRFRKFLKQEKFTIERRGKFTPPPF